jgi:hypothetical protein
MNIEAIAATALCVIALSIFSLSVKYHCCNLMHGQKKKRKQPSPLPDMNAYQSVYFSLRKSQKNSFLID